MSFMCFRRQLITLSFTINSHFPSRLPSYSSRPTRPCQAVTESFINDSKPTSAANANFRSGVFHLSPLFKDNNKNASLKDCRIELVDDETWSVSSGLADSWKGTGNVVSGKNTWFNEDDEIDNGANSCKPLKDEDEPDFDEIEDMRIRGNLFYKLDKDSKEYEEYKFEFHRRNKNKNNGNEGSEEKEQSSSVLASRVEKSLKITDKKRINKKEVLSYDSSYGVDRSMVADIDNHLQEYRPHEFGASATKRLRTPTFNQLTAPYHEPFCLDIYVSKGSVSASVIHRATSKVVVVAHSISKDMKFDLGSTKNRTTCAAVGEVLAQRALADDIHNVVYTPRKGEKLEGKLEIVLQSIINNGINVKVKIKQRKTRKAGFHRATA